MGPDLHSKKRLAFQDPNRLTSQHVTHHLVDHCWFHCRLVCALDSARRTANGIYHDHGPRHRRIDRRWSDRTDLLQTGTRFGISSGWIHHVFDLRDPIALALGQIWRRNGALKREKSLSPHYRRPAHAARDGPRRQPFQLAVAIPQTSSNIGAFEWLRTRKRWILSSSSCTGRTLAAPMCK